MNRHAATYEHERLRPGRAIRTREARRRIHLLPPIDEPAPAAPLANTAREALEAIAQDGGCSIDLVGGRFFIRKAYIAPTGRPVGTYNAHVTLSEIADDLQAALAEDFA